MTRYLVQWTIDVDEEDIDTPEAAARFAQAKQQKNREDYWCGIFQVMDNSGDQLGPPIDVDLDALDECAKGFHSWIDHPTKLPPDTKCDHCGELYGHPH